MGWGKSKQGYTVQPFDFSTPDGVVCQFSVGDTDGEDYLQIRGVKDAHGKDVQLSMGVRKFESILDNEESIRLAIADYRNVKGKIARLKARKALWVHKLANLDSNRDIMDGPAYNGSLARLKAQFTDLFPVEQEANADLDKEPAETE